MNDELENIFEENGRGPIERLRKPMKSCSQDSRSSGRDSKRASPVYALPPGQLLGHTLVTNIIKAIFFD
jgi:hypothetical protein